VREVIIVGGGLTGLTCARALKEQGVDFLLLEAHEQVGGRVRSSKINGFLLDHGFQIFLSAYPEAQRWLDYDALDLRPFYAGAQIQTLQGPIRVGDPRRQPESALATALAQLGGLGDKARILHLIQDLLRHSLPQLLQRPERSTVMHLRQLGFSEGFIQSFFQPFLAGVFLDPHLQTSSHLFHFVMKMFTQGTAAVPAQGMQAIPEHLLRWLPAQQVRLGAAVARAEAGRVVLRNGENLPARAVVVATDYSAAARLLRLPPRRFQASRTLYFAASQPPVDLPILVLNGRGTGPINHLAVMSLVAPEYAPPGQHLIALCLLAPWTERPLAQLLPKLQRQLLEWFGEAGQGWELLQDLTLPHSLPVQLPLTGLAHSRSCRLVPGLYLGGDHSEQASINGAMAAGRHLAAQVWADLSAG